MTILKNKARRRGVFGILTAVLLVGLTVLQLFLFSFLREGRFFADMTTEGIYTMTDLMRLELSEVTEPVTVSFCADPDRCLANDDLRPIYILAKELEAEKTNIRVETLNLRENSHAADAYKPIPGTEIKETDVIVSYGQKHRLAEAEKFYSRGEDGERWSFKGEYQLANMILSVVRIEAPVAYFTVGHGERYFDAEAPEHTDNASLLSFYDSLLDLGMSVKTVSLDEVAALPEDCVLLIMNGPDRDYVGDGSYGTLSSPSATEKLDRYLREGGSMLYLRDPEVKTDALPILHEFLAEWGIAYNDDTVKEDRTASGVREELSVTYATSATGNIAYSFYQAIADLATAPRTLLSDSSSLYCPWVDTTEKTLLDNVSRASCPLFFSSETTARYNASGELLHDGGVYPLGMVGVEAVLRADATYRHSYVMALGSTSFITERYFGASAYGNRDVMTALLRTLTRTDSYASSDLGSSDDMNSANFGGKIYDSDDFVTGTVYVYKKNGRTVRTTTQLSAANGYELQSTLHPISDGETVFLTLLTTVIPIGTVLIVGLCILLRRRHL